MKDGGVNGNGEEEDKMGWDECMLVLVLCLLVG